MSRTASIAASKLQPVTLVLPPSLHSLFSGLLTTLNEKSVQIVAAASGKILPRQVPLVPRASQSAKSPQTSRLSVPAPERGSTPRSVTSRNWVKVNQSGSTRVASQARSWRPSGVCQRHFSLSRPVRNQFEMSESDLAHLAAQRQIEANSSSSFLKPMLFTIGVSAFAWTSAEYWRVNKYYIRKEYRQYVRELYASWGLEDPYPPPFRGRTQPLNPSSFSLSQVPILGSLTPAQKLMAPIIAICCGVFAMWQFPVFGLRFMYKNFAHFPESGIARTLLTSAFSHATPLHLAFNMLALWSFSEAAYPLLGPEYYLATVASGAVVASMAQHAYGLMLGSNPALGASGFVFSIVTYVALSYPNNQALLFFVIPAPLLGLLQGLVVFDFIGLTGIWTKMFNLRLTHAAHLGGVALGAAVWWLNQMDNRRRLAKSMPEEAVGLYNKSYDALIKRY